LLVEVGEVAEGDCWFVVSIVPDCGDDVVLVEDDGCCALWSVVLLVALDDGCAVWSVLLVGAGVGLISGVVAGGLFGNCWSLRELCCC
jgi:hypothetical protein